MFWLLPVSAIKRERVLTKCTTAGLNLKRGMGGGGGGVSEDAEMTEF